MRGHMEYWRHIGAWRSLVARTVRVGEVPSSNLGAPIFLSAKAGGLSVQVLDGPLRQVFNHVIRPCPHEPWSLA